MMILKNSAKIGRVLATTLIFLIFNLTNGHSAGPDSTKVYEHPLWEEDVTAGVTVRQKSAASAPVLLIPSGDNISVDSNGGAWKTFYRDSLYIFLNTRYMHDHGKYYLIDVYVQNNSSSPLFFDFNNASVTGAGRTSPFWSYERYLGKVRRQNGWAAFGAGMATAIGFWILDYILNGSYFDGYADHYSVGLDILHGTSSIFLQEMSYIGAMAVAESFERDYLRCTRKELGFLTPYNIPASSSVRGHTLAKYIPGADIVTINLPIGNKVYSFEWNTTGLEDVGGADSL